MMRGLFRSRVGNTVLVTIGVFQAIGMTNRAQAVDILDDPVQIDERVTQLIQASNSLCWEINRYHQQKPDYSDTYRAAKQIWTDATQIQADLRTSTVETEILQQKVVAINQTFAGLADSLSKWGPGDQSNVPTSNITATREVVAPGVGISVPFVGIQIGAPDVVVQTETSPQLQRRRLHVNAHGSKRSLERELDSVRMAVSNLAEDAGVPFEEPAQDIPAINNTPAPPAPKPQGEVVKPRS